MMSDNLFVTLIILNNLSSIFSHFFEIFSLSISSDFLCILDLLNTVNNV